MVKELTEHKHKKATLSHCFDTLTKAGDVSH